MADIRSGLGLDEPLPVQYAKTVWSYVRGDFGVSIASHRPVSDDSRGDDTENARADTLRALALQIVLGLLLGAISARYPYGVFDRTLSVVFLVFYSIPSFYLAFALIALFSIELGWLPSANMYSIPPEAARFFAASRRPRGAHGAARGGARAGERRGARAVRAGESSRRGPSGLHQDGPGEGARRGTGSSGSTR